MSVNEIVYQVAPNGITPQTEQHGGTQSEHRAVKLVFNLTDNLREKLLPFRENGKLVYRFDAYDGEGSLVPGVPKELGTDTVPEFYLEQWLTRVGGKIRIYLVITALTDGSTEMELYSFPACLVFNNLPHATLKDDADNFESVSVAAQNAIDAAENAIDAAQNAVKVSHSAKEVADIANDAAQKAIETSNSVRADADSGVFNGERGERGPSGVYVGSGPMPEDCNVQIDPSGDTLDASQIATRAYVDERISNFNPEDVDVDLSDYPTREEMQDAISAISTDYIVERGVTDIWTWEKWNSGKAECWCQVDYPSVKFTTAWGSLFTADNKFGGRSYPFEFVNVPQEYQTIIRSEALCFIGMHDNNANTTTSATFNLLRATSVDFGYDITIGIRAIGRWK